MANMASRAALGLRLYKFNKPNVLTEEGAHLPESYKKFYREWKLTPPQPVHYIPSTNKWARNEDTGQVERVPDFPIPLKFPPESHLGIWGGEGVIKGYKRKGRWLKFAHWWIPNIKLSAVYSEILDKRMILTVTNRTIDLIINNNGFDHYLLKTPACDLQSSTALKLKRTLLYKLSQKEMLYKTQPDKAAELLHKYGHYLEQVWLPTVINRWFTGYAVEM